MAAAALDGLQLLNLVDAPYRQAVDRFMADSRATTHAEDLTHMKWVTEAMRLLAPTTLANNQKKALVSALYHDLNRNDGHKAFNPDFDVQSAIEFIWDVSKNKFGIVLRRKGFLQKCLPCCSDVSVVYDQGQVQLNIRPLAPGEEAAAAPQ